MANSYPYISGPGNLAQMISHLRKSFPQTVTSDTVKKLGLASKNESYVINALQFIGIIDEEGKKTDEGSSVFSNHKDEDFSKEFSNLIKKAYSALFELHGDSAWSIDIGELITFFRQTDQTSEAIGKRQAKTFLVFAGISGHGVIPSTRASKIKVEPNPTIVDKRKTKKPSNGSTSNPDLKFGEKDIGLTVRIEINLPTEGTKQTYDDIFKSIKENLING